METLGYFHPSTFFRAHPPLIQKSSSVHTKNCHVSKRGSSSSPSSPSSSSSSSSSSSFLRISSSLSVSGTERRTCKNCKKQFSVTENNPRACRYHTAHYGGETKRKFEGVYTGGTMSTKGGGEVTSYWHCCGNSDAFDIGCEASPHLSYDD